MTDDEADTLIDAQLRNVAVPAELAVRLRQLADWPDEQLDRELTDVVVPVLLNGRLKCIANNEELDERLRDVSQPVTLRARLRDIAARSQRRQQAGSRSLAASLLLALTLSYGAFAWQLLFGARHGVAPPPTTFAVMQPDAVHLHLGQSEAELVIATVEDEPAEESGNAQFVSISQAEPLTLVNEARRLSPVTAIFGVAQAGKLDLPLSLPVLGAPIPDGLPQLDLVQLPQARGVVTPMTPSYNRSFLLRTGVHPPIPTGLNPILQQSLAPLSVTTDSFDQVRALLAAKKRIAMDQVRTEDFIAAVDHNLPAPSADELSLSAFGSITPFGPERTRLLGLGVRAGEAMSRRLPSTHLVIAVDFSGGLARSGNWPWVREALLETLARLGSDDRVSLVFYQDEVLMASAPLERKDALLLRQRLASATPHGEVDPAIGIEAALDVALAAETPAKTRRLAVLTDGHFELAAPHHKRLQLIADQAADADIDIDVVRVGGGRSVAEGAAAVSRAVRANLSNFDVRRGLVHGLLRFLHGDAAITAKEAKLVVRFVPEAVAAYRLIGHEANTMAQLTPPSQVVELRAGDEALVMFELLPTAHSAEMVAEVELSWLAPGSSDRRSTVRRVSRLEMLQSWDAMPPAFRAATIAAETAEQLRGSRSALRELQWGRNADAELSELLRHARALRSSADDNAFQSLVGLLEDAAARPELERR